MIHVIITELELRLFEGSLKELLMLYRIDPNREFIMYFKDDKVNLIVIRQEIKK